MLGNGQSDRFYPDMVPPRQGLATVGRTRARRGSLLLQRHHRALDRLNYIIRSAHHQMHAFAGRPLPTRYVSMSLEEDLSAEASAMPDACSVVLADHDINEIRLLKHLAGTRAPAR